MTAIVVQANNTLLRLTANFLSSAQVSGNDKSVQMYCTDGEMFDNLSRYCQRTGIAAKILDAEINDSVPPGDHRYGTRIYSRFLLWKIERFLRLSAVKPFEPFLYLDADIVLLRNVEFGLQQARQDNPGYSLIIQSNKEDYSIPTMEEEQYCAGVIYQLRSETLFWTSVYEWLESNIDSGSTIETGRRIHGGGFVEDEGAIHLVLKGLGRQLGVLPPTLFRVGRQPLDGEPILLHRNWMIGNAEKEESFRKHGWWFANDEVLKDLS